MRAFLGVSLAPEAQSRLRRPNAEALACLTDGDAVVDRVDTEDDGWMAFAGIDDRDLVGEPGEPFTLLLSRLLRTREDDLSARDLIGMMADASQLATLLPPFAAAHRGLPGGPVSVATDWLGFRQLYWWRGAGAAAVSTSARALAVLAGQGFDQTGLGAQAMIGWQVGDRTLFEGVRALPPATIATLAAGDLSLHRYAEPLVHAAAAPTLDDAVEEMAQILVSWQSRYLQVHPDAVLQLTGGHDSRILLGAIPKEQRAGLHANPFAPEFEGETTYLASNMPGTSTVPTQFRSLQAQDDATGVLGPMPCGMYYSNSQSTMHYTPFVWGKTDHNCDSFDIWTQ